MRVRARSDDGQVVRRMSEEHQVNVKSQSELDIGGRKTCNGFVMRSDLGIMGFLVPCRLQ